MTEATRRRLIVGSLVLIVLLLALALLGRLVGWFAG